MASKVRESLAKLGVHLRESWVAHCLNDPSTSLGGAENGDGGSYDKACEEIYRIFLACDLREAGTACLPAGVAEMVEDRINGNMVLQASIRSIDRNLFMDDRYSPPSEGEKLWIDILSTCQLQYSTPGFFDLPFEEYRFVSCLGFPSRSLLPRDK